MGGRETGQWREADLSVAHWLQHTSRDGDMQLHVHSQIAHVARTVTDGKWRQPGCPRVRPPPRPAGGAGARRRPPHPAPAPRPPPPRPPAPPRTPTPPPPT